MADYLFGRTKHNFVRTGDNYGEDYECTHCRISCYQTKTEYCEDVAQEKREREEKKAGTHVATNEALDIVRKVLTKEQWALVGLKYPYRIKDVISV